MKIVGIRFSQQGLSSHTSQTHYNDYAKDTKE